MDKLPCKARPTVKPAEPSTAITELAVTPNWDKIIKNYYNQLNVGNNGILILYVKDKQALQIKTGKFSYNFLNFLKDFCKKTTSFQVVF